MNGVTGGVPYLLSVCGSFAIPTQGMTRGAPWNTIIPTHDMVVFEIPIRNIDNFEIPICDTANCKISI